MNLHLKDLDVLNVDKKLQEICEDLCNHSSVACTITSAYRPGDPGVHGTQPLRGLDLRCKIASIGKATCDYINSRWQYDPSRPDKVVAMYHNVGQGDHIHLQVHPNTISL